MTWRESMQSSGFAIIPGVLTKTDVADLLKNTESVPMHRSRAGVRHALQYSPIAAVACDPQILAIAQGILGESAFPFRATLFEKSLLANWLVVWHQDTALPLRERKEALGWGPWSVKDGVTYAHAPADALSRVLAVRIHLDDSTAANGPLPFCREHTNWACWKTRP